MGPTPLADAADEATFGGKGAALARAIRAGLPVPPGFALSWEAVAAIAAGSAADDAVAMFRGLGGAVSVRSSAVGEDSAGASFAGQHLTVLNVCSDASLVDAIRSVHASANTAAAREYRARMGVAGDARIAVVVQRMIESDTAGVLFTANPLTCVDERVVEAAWGLGEAVVAGIVTPDRYRFRRGGEVVERTAGLKDIAIRFAGDGTEEQAVDAERARQLCLSDADLAELDRLASICEEAFGPNLDLEWAFEGGRLYLLQSRPITKVNAPPPGEYLGVPRSTSGTSASSEESPPRNSEELRGTPRNSNSLTPRRLTGFALAAILSPLNSTMIAVALPAIGSSLDASGATLTLWLVSAYLLVSIIGQSPAGKMSDLFGYSPVLTSGRIIFAAGALLGAIAPSVALLAIARMAMAIGGALNIPPVLAELRNQVAPERRGRLFGFFGALMGTAAAIGPLLGEVLIRGFGWHSVFLVNVPIIALSLLLEPPHRGARAEGKTLVFDISGSVLFAVAMALIVGGMQLRTAAGVGVSAVGVIVLLLFVRHERRTPEPLLDPRLFAIRSFSAGSGIVALQNFAMYAILFLVPFLLVANGQRGGAGAFLLAMTGAMVVASPIGGRVSDAIGARVTTLAGSLTGAAGAAMLFALATAQPWMLVASLAILGAGIGFSTSPSQAAALSGVPRSDAGVAAGAMSTMRYVGGVAGSAVVAMIVASPASAPLVWLFPIALLVSGAAALLLPGRIYSAAGAQPA